MDFNDYLNRLIDKKDLNREEAKDLLGILIDEAVDEDITRVLKAFAEKGETVEEIAGFAEGMRELMLTVNSPQGGVDIVGTGGDGSNSFNISTVSAIVAAACGLDVIKHGNRAASSKCGSADVLEELGVNINLTPEQAEAVLKKVGMVFLFAPAFHPAMKKVGPIRRELKTRTIFNYLGPFLNPGKVKKMLLGVTDLKLSEKFLEIAKQLDFEHLIIVTSQDGLDEISIADKTTAFELKNGKVHKFIIDPEKLGFKKYSKDDLVGGEPKVNAQIAKDILSGEEVGAKKDAVILNSAYALLITGKVKDVKEGIDMARESINSGKSFSILKALIKETNSMSS
jgi:anthranilate phosphoribosyltransferase